MADVPNSFRDPYWSQLSAATETKLGLPAGLLSGIVTNGERSNADQVSEAGARTPFQITPTTRRLAIDKYGIDPYLSPDNAAEVAGRLLKDSLQRNGGDLSSAIGEYHGGTDRKNWGAKTQAYIGHVLGALVPSANAAESGALQPSAIANIYQAYKTGKMTPQEAADFESDVKAGNLTLPQGATLSAVPSQAGPVMLPQSVTDAYVGGKMTDQERSDLESDIKAGLVKLPPTLASQIPTEESGWKAPTEQPIIAQQKEPGLLDKLAGAGETALSLATGATGGAIGMLAGEVGGITKSLLDGTYGTQQAADMVEKAATEGAQALTYEPRTPTGQQYTQAVGEGLQQVLPALPLAQTAVAGAMAAPAIAQARAPVQAAAEKVGQTAADLAKRAQATMTPGEKPTPGTIGSAGTAPAEASEQASATVGQVPPVTARSAPEQVLSNPTVRARPSDAAPTGQAMSERGQVLDAIGLPADQRRVGALTGNRQQIQNEVMISKLDGAERMKQQFAAEAEHLGDYAAAIQRDTGGVPGANALQRGEAISAPLEAYQRWYLQQIKGLYQAADQAAVESGAQIRPTNLSNILNTASVFAGKEENSALRRGLRSYLREQGIIDRDGALSPIGAESAEGIKQYLNSQWSPQTSGLIGKIKGAIDDDVLSVLPQDIYANARAMRRQYAQIFEEPTGLARILDIGGPEGINRAISLDTLPDTLANWAARNSAQFGHVVKTLESMPTPELQAAGRQAISEMRAHIVERMLGRNVDQGEVALGGHVQWSGTDQSLSRAMAPYRGKLNDLLGKDLANRMETLKVGARILRPFDPNPSGTATAALNLQSEMSKRAITTAAGAAGAAAGALSGGPLGATGGAISGAAAARKIINIRQQRAIDRAISRSLDASEQQKWLKEISKKAR